MPAPPRKGESKPKFIARAVRVLIREGKSRDQAVAIAHEMWRRAGRGAGRK